MTDDPPEGLLFVAKQRAAHIVRMVELIRLDPRQDDTIAEALAVIKGEALAIMADSTKTAERGRNDGQ